MSDTPILDHQAPGLSSASGLTLLSRPLQPPSDPSVSKRVCFYKSGDYKFSGHRLVINARTFKTFDALLDALSKKVPLPFGVRTITTPQGTHLVKALHDLNDGGSYVCSDQKRVKPLNLNEVNRRQVPWNATRPLSAGRQRRLQFGRGYDFRNGPAKVTERVAVRTPKRLTVIKNKDATVKRTIVLQRRTAPTFDALLDYLSQILQFPVLKLFSTDGQRVDGLAALILCSGVVVAAGNEPFRLGNYSFHQVGQMAQVMYMETEEPSILQPRAQNNKPFSSGRGSRNFSLSSEQYIVNQINKSRNGSPNNHLHQHNGSFESELNQRRTSTETRGDGRFGDEHHACILPHDDDIEKSFCVNQDGSMTVEMKVRLTIKEEEMLHWTTTLSRTSLSKRTVCASICESGNRSPDSNNAIAKDSSNVSEDDTKEENRPTEAGKGVYFDGEDNTSTALRKAKTCIKRTPTPGPRHIQKKASVDSVKTVTESGVQESSLGHYSYMERTADGETTEGYCVVRHRSSSSSSNRPIPKPRKTASAGARKKGSHSTIRSSGAAEVLQIESNGMEVTESVMHIYESRACFDNYYANEEYGAGGLPPRTATAASDSKPSTETGLRSSSNDIDFSWQPATADSLQRLGEDMLSLSSEPISPACEITNKLFKVTTDDIETATNSKTEGTETKVKVPQSEKNKVTMKPARNHKSSPTKSSKHSSTDKHSSNASAGKKSLGSSESAKSGQKSKGTDKKVASPQSRKSVQDEKTPKVPVALDDTENKIPPKRQSKNKMPAKDNGHNVNSPTGRPQMKKNISDILKPKKSPLPRKGTVSKPKSMTENRMALPKKPLELNESVSMPSLNPTPSEIHRYVENWLEKVSQDQVPYTESTQDEREFRSKAVFVIGGGSETDENNGCKTNVAVNDQLSGDAVRKSKSCLAVPLYQEGPETSLLCSEQKTRGLCVSMPSVKVDTAHRENDLRADKSAEAIGAADNESTSSTANILSPTETMKPVLRQLASSIQCLRNVSDTNTASKLEKSNSLPDFSTQVASVFGTPCKAFLSFLSVMTLRENLKDSALGDGHRSRSGSEAMLMMQSLLKISAIEDKEEQRASLTDLHSRASSQFRERWQDFQILRERLQSEPLSPKVSETEFALDVVSEGGDVFEDQHPSIDDLMEELNMPQDLRAEMSLTIQQAGRFYPVEESTFVENERNQSDSEEDVERFVDNVKSTDPDDACTVGNFTDEFKELISMYSKKAKVMSQQDAVQEMCPDVKDSGASQTEAIEEDQVEDVEGNRGGERAREHGEIEETNDGGEKVEKIEKEREEETDREAESDNDEEQDDREAERSSVEGSLEKVKDGTEEEMTADEEPEEEMVEELEEGRIDRQDQEGRGDNSFEETDEREGVEETEEEDQGKYGVGEEADEEKRGEECEAVESEEELDEELKEEVIEETEEKEEIEHAADKMMEEEEVDMDSEEDDEEEERTEFVCEEEEEEEEEEKCQSIKVPEGTENRLAESRKANDAETEGSSEAEQTLAEEEGAGDEEKELNEGLDEVERRESKESAAEDGDCKTPLEEVSYLGQSRSSHEEADTGKSTGSPTKHSSEGQREFTKGNGTDCEPETDEGGQRGEGTSGPLPHPVEISQELLDFVNSALQSSSLTFTYDARGNIRIEPDNARVVQTKQLTVIPKSRRESSDGFRRLPSPGTSDLSDYRPDTSESGGYKSQDSIDIVTESGEEASGGDSPVHRQENDGTSSKLSPTEQLQSPGLQSAKSFSSSDSGAKASKEDLSYFSAASSLKADVETAQEVAPGVPLTSERDASDGVLIDRGRWLLKENHLIRKSPPIALGMYGDADSTSVDTDRESPPPCGLAQQNPLADISSSELEEMAKPQTPKCTFFNMSHGSDSDPFMYDSSGQSGKRDGGSVKGRGFRVSPTIDTSKTWPKKAGSLPSFASVEFKMADGKVHPEEEAEARLRRTSSGGGGVLQPQDSLETLNVRCGQYCPIL